MPVIDLKSKKYRLISDNRCWMLQEKIPRKDRKGNTQVEEWRAIRWYTTLEGALMGVAEFRLRAKEHACIWQAFQEVKSLLAGLSKNRQLELFYGENDRD